MRVESLLVGAAPMSCVRLSMNVHSGLLIFRGIFSGKFTGKSADFAGFSREKSKNSLKNQPTSRDFRGILAEKVKF